jgi:hypothetical protein
MYFQVRVDSCESGDHALSYISWLHYFPFFKSGLLVPYSKSYAIAVLGILQRQQVAA